MKSFDSLALELAGENLIEASAGTGKTYAIASLYVRLVVEKQLGPENILVVTFTKAATKELRDRIRSRLALARDAFSGLATTDDVFLLDMMDAGKNQYWPGPELACERLESALRQFDCAAISTIHGFCNRMLLDFAFESGSLYNTEVVEGQEEITRSLAEDFWRRNFFAGDISMLSLAEKDGRISSPEAMTAFVKSILKPDILIVPELDDGKVSAADSACHDAYHKVCAMWRARFGEVSNLLRDKEVHISRGPYRDDELDKLFTGMEAYVANGNPYALFRDFVKLTTEFLAESTLKKADGPPGHPLFPLCSDLADLVDKRRVALRWQVYDFIKGRLPAVKTMLNKRFNNDLLTDLDQALSGPCGERLADRIRGKFRAALIDEFQDTDQTQYRIFSKVFSGGEATMCLIGDPKQAIYSFRGADIYAYLKAREDVPVSNHFTMDKNWRSVPLMVDAVNHLFTWKGGDRPLVIESLEYPGVTAAKPEVPLRLSEERDASPIQMWFFKLGEEDKKGKVISKGRGKPRVVAAVGEEIAHLLADSAAGTAVIDDRALVPSDIAVVVRTNSQASWIYDELVRRNIPAVIRSNESVFATSEANDLAAVLAAVIDPGREATLRRALITSLFGRDGNGIAAMLEPEGADEWVRLIGNFRDYHDLWRERGFMAMFRTMLERDGIRGRMLSIHGGERAVTNLLHCGEILHSEEVSSRLGMDSLYEWFSGSVSQPPEGEEHQIRLESDEKAVKILTIHVSKGLEFNIVFCPFSWWVIEDKDDDFASCHVDYTMIADIGSDDLEKHLTIGREENLAESVRLLYVALTRAKYRCYVAWGKFNDAETSSLAYLLHRPDVAAGDLTVPGLVAAMKGLDDFRIKDCLDSLVEAKPGCIFVTENPAGGDTVYEPTDVSAEKLCSRPPRIQIKNDWKVSSFTSLSGGHRDAAELPDHDDQEDAAVGESVRYAPGDTIFGFPSGALAGTFMHAVLEKVDFAEAGEDAVSELVAATLEDPRFSNFGKKWIPVITQMVMNVVSAQLGDGLRLCDLGPKSWTPEMEFFFPLRFVGSRQVADVLRSHVGGGYDLRHLADSLDFREQCGMLRGFVDLVFTHGGRYYILDWKSNHLGNSPEDYIQERMSRKMDHNLYTWQYLLYTVALNRHLARHNRDYSYERDFGGVYYLFLRGIDPGCPGNGVFHDLPDPGLVRDLTSCLIDFEGA